MIYGKELAPNLFNRFRDWYLNYVQVTGAEPSDQEVEDAVKYYKGLEEQ